MVSRRSLHVTDQLAVRQPGGQGASQEFHKTVALFYRDCRRAQQPDRLSVLRSVRTMGKKPPPIPKLDPPEGATRTAEKPTQVETGAKASAGTLVATAGAAARLVARQAERTKLASITLPAAYRALGRDCVQQKRHLDWVPDLVKQLRMLQGELRTLAEADKGKPVAQSLADKAKGAGKQAVDLARRKQLEVQRDSVMAKIGEAIHSEYGEASGSEELVASIRAAVSRLSEVNAEILRLSEAENGSWLTPKRMLLAGAGMGMLCLLIAVAWLSDGSSGQSEDGLPSGDRFSSSEPRLPSRRGFRSSPGTRMAADEAVRNLKRAGAYTPEAERNIRTMYDTYEKIMDR